MIILPTGPVPFDALSGRFRWLLLGDRQGTILADWLQAMEAGIATSSGHLQTPTAPSSRHASSLTQDDVRLPKRRSDPAASSRWSRSSRLFSRTLRKAVGGFVHFSRRWPTDCVADGAPMHTGRVRGCQPTGRAAGEYWHLFSHRYLLSSAKHGPTLSHYHERHRHTGHGIENSTVLCSLPFLPPSLWPPPPTCPRKATVRIRSINDTGGNELSTPTERRSKKVQRGSLSQQEVDRSVSMAGPVIGGRERLSGNFCRLAAGPAATIRGGLTLTFQLSVGEPE